MKQTQRLALRVAERRQRRSGLVAGQVHVDEVRTLQAGLDAASYAAARRGTFPITGLYDDAPPITLTRIEETYTPEQAKKIWDHMRAIGVARDNGQVP
jgi:hypothetical protein